MAKPERQVVLWPSRENYAAFAAACTDDVADSYDDFVRQADGRIEHLRKIGVLRSDLVIEKLNFDPADMRRWCLVKTGKVDTQTRAKYASWLSSKGDRDR